MKSAFRPARTALLTAICLVLMLALNACEFPGVAAQSEGSGSNLATQEQPLGGSGGGTSGAGEAGGRDFPSLICPTGEESKDDRAAFEVDYDLTWSPPQGPHITLRQNFVFTAAYTPSEDVGTDTLTGTLKFENLGPQNATFTIVWPECMKDDEPVSQKFSFTPTITGSCAGGVITIAYTEKWESGQMLIPCKKGSRICGDSDDCKPVPWYMPFGMGPAGRLERDFTIDRRFTVVPPSYPVPFLGLGGSGGRTVKLEWLP